MKKSSAATALLALVLLLPAWAAAFVIPATGRADMVHDFKRNRIYITAGASVLRYDRASSSFLPPVTFTGGVLVGIDISPDGAMVAVADDRLVGGNVVVHLVDLDSLATRDLAVAPAFSEVGSWSVAFGADGTLLTCGEFGGSGWVPLRRFNVATGVGTAISSVRQDTMLTASGDRQRLGWAESNSSDGPWGRYTFATRTLEARSGYTDGTSWFNYEIGTNRNGTQFAIPTYGGTFFYDNTLKKVATIGTYAGPQPVGVAYHPVENRVFFPWAGTNEVRIYETKTFTQVGALSASQTFTNNGGWAYGSGRTKVSADGSVLMVGVSNGVEVFDLYAPLTASNTTAVTTMNRPVQVTLPGSVGNGGMLTWSVTAPPASGHVTINGAVATYTPVPGFTGSDQFTFVVSYGLAQVQGTASITVQPAGSLEVNFALQSNGGVAFASSEYGRNYPARAVNNGERAGIAMGGANGPGGAWIDATSGTYPDWLEIDFNGVKKIDTVVVYSLQDNYQAPVEPLDTMTFTQYGVTAFDVQAWDGSRWQTVGTVAGNNLVKRSLSFVPVDTTRIRVSVNGSLNGLARITEIEAWGQESTWAAGWTKNVALASEGASATASSEYSSSYPAYSVIDGDSAGAQWSAGGGWADATSNSYPDWVEVRFAAQTPIDHVVVYTVQDNWQDPSPPTDSMAFTQYGIVDFDVEGWDGTRWVVLGAVTNNGFVKRTVQLGSPFTTDRIRVNVTRALGNYARITEVQAFTVVAPTTAQPPMNVALASAGATVQATSQLDAGFPVAAVIDGDTAGTHWSNGGGWADGTAGQYPDWVEVDFAGNTTIDRVVVYTLQDNWQSPSTPTDTMTFTQYGITDFDVQGWDGAHWITLGSVRGNNLVKRTVTFNAFATTRIRVSVLNALNGYSRITEIEAWTPGSAPALSNLALASAGAAASASSQYGAGYPVYAVIDGDAMGTGWSSGGGWADGTGGQFPDWVRIDFPTPAALSKVVVYTLQDAWQNPSPPTDAMTFTQYGIVDFDVQGWNGSQWVTLASVRGNNLVKRTLTFNPFTTSAIRVSVLGALATYSRITEIEAWGERASVTPTGLNVALAAGGATASASSQYGSSYPASATIDGERAGAGWSAGGGWADGTAGQFPDWLEVDFNGSKTLNTVIVYTVQDNWQAPIEPTDTMTFTQYGITDFTVQAWDGAQWQTVATVTGNNLVKRSLPVSVTTTKIRVNVTGALNSLSRITEIEAWGN